MPRPASSLGSPTLKTSPPIWGRRPWTAFSRGWQIPCSCRWWDPAPLTSRQLLGMSCLLIQWYVPPPTSIPSASTPSHASPQPLTSVMASITPTLGLMSVDTMLLEDIAMSQTNPPTVSEEDLDFIEEAESSPPAPYDYSPQVDTALTLKTSSPVKSETKETTTPPMKRLPGGSSTTISTRTMMTTRSS